MKTNNRNAKHTPGPWTVSQETDVMTLTGIIQCTNATQARLIAAAPKLLEFLIKHQTKLNNFFDGLEGPFSDSKRDLNDLICKATGGAE